MSVYMRLQSERLTPEWKNESKMGEKEREKMYWRQNSRSAIEYLSHIRVQANVRALHLKAFTHLMHRYILSILLFSPIALEMKLQRSIEIYIV